MDPAAVRLLLWAIGLAFGGGLYVAVVRRNQQAIAELWQERDEAIKERAALRTQVAIINTHLNRLLRKNGLPPVNHEEAE